MKSTRQWHLWIGLVSSFFIFIQALTGLIMSEPWIIGQSQNEKGMMPNRQNVTSGTQPNNGTNNSSNTENATTTELANNNGSTSSTTNNSDQDSQNQSGNFQTQNGFGGQNGQGGAGNRGGEQSGIMGIIKGLHQGQIGGVDLHIYIDILAICLMLLTATGIVLSIKVLKAQAKRNKKQKVASSLE